MTLLAILAVALGLHADPRDTLAIEHAAARHHADLPLVSAVCCAESSVGVHGTILCGAHLRLPLAACMADPAFAARVRAARRARRRLPLCLNRDRDAQADFPARLFGGVARRHWPRMLANYRCGPNPACQRTVGAAYAARVLALRARFVATQRRGR